MNQTVPETHFNQLTPDEDERLAILSEECAEVIQVVCKIQRHGYESKNPLEPTSETNRMMLEREIGHIQAAVHALASRHDINIINTEFARSAKQKSIHRWLHHQTT